MKRLLIALMLGGSMTAILFGLAYVTAGSTVSRIAFWQGWYLQSLVPPINIGTEDHPLLEATPMHLFAFLAGLPVGVAIYALAAYLLLGFLPRCTFQRTASPPLD